MDGLPEFGPRRMLLPSRERAVQRIVAALTQDTPVILIAGESGTGRSTVLGAAMRALAWPAVALPIESPAPEPVAIFARMAQRLGLPEARSDQLPLLLDAIGRWNRATRGQARLVLGIDDADQLPQPVLDFADLLAGLTGSAAPVLRFVVVGPPALAELLDARGARHLSSGAVVELEKLRPAEARTYLRHMLRAVGRPVAESDIAPLLDEADGKPEAIARLARGEPDPDTAAPPEPPRVASNNRQAAPATARGPRPLVPDKPAHPTPTARTRRFDPRLAGMAAFALCLGIAFWQFMPESPPQPPAPVPSLAKPAPFVSNPAPSAPPPSSEVPDSVLQSPSLRSPMRESITSELTPTPLPPGLQQRAEPQVPLPPSPLVPLARDSARSAQSLIGAAIEAADRLGSTLTEAAARLPAAPVRKPAAPPAEAAARLPAAPVRKPAAPPAEAAPLPMLPDGVETRVIVHLEPGVPAARRDAALAALAGDAVTVPPAWPVRESRHALVSYYFRSDQAAAEDVARRLAGLVGPAKPVLAPPTAQPPPPGSVEVTIPAR